MAQRATDAEGSAQTLTLDLSTLTVGEASRLEMESGQDFARMLTAGRSTRLLLVLWVQEQRSSAQPRSWRELSSLPLSDAMRSISPSRSTGPSVKSSD